MAYRMKILITGDRHWTDYKTMCDVLEKHPAGTILVHGACRGADLMAASIGRSLKFDVRSYPAKWKQYGRAAGVIRNQEMLDKENTDDELIDICIAFHNDIANSRGTKDMLDRVNKTGMNTKLVTSNG